MGRLVEFVTKTKLSRVDDDTGRFVTDKYEPRQRVELDDERAMLAIGNGWAREVNAND